MAYQQNSRASGSAMALARGLGWFSIGLGLAEMLAPRMLTEQMGMQGKESLLRFYGAREMAAGVGILMSDNPAPWVWGRVAAMRSIWPPSPQGSTSTIRARAMSPLRSPQWRASRRSTASVLRLLPAPGR